MCMYLFIHLYEHAVSRNTGGTELVCHNNEQVISAALNFVLPDLMMSMTQSQTSWILHFYITQKHF